MAVDNRLTKEQLAALAPGDPVVIETSGDFRRPRRSPGTVVRLSGPHIVVSCCSRRGVTYLHEFGRRDGVCVGGGRWSELVDLELAEPVATDQRRQLLVVDAAYREWARDRADVERLRQRQRVRGSWGPTALAKSFRADLVSTLHRKLSVRR